MANLNYLHFGSALQRIIFSKKKYRNKKKLKKNPLILAFGEIVQPPKLHIFFYIIISTYFII